MGAWYDLMSSDITVLQAMPDEAFENQKWEEQQDRDRKARGLREMQARKLREAISGDFSWKWIYLPDVFFTW